MGGGAVAGQRDGGVVVVKVEPVADGEPEADAVGNFLIAWIVLAEQLRLEGLVRFYSCFRWHLKE